MDLGLAGKSALIVGGSQGIGKAVATRLTEEGAQIAICSRRSALLEETAYNIRSATGAKVLSIVCDITRIDDVRNLVKQTIAGLGTIHILVNCASAPPVFSNILEWSDEAWRAVFETKFMGYLRCINEVLPYMIQQRDGRIVNITGIAGIVPHPLHLLEGSDAAALNQVTKGIALVMAKHNIRINALLPGLTATERHNRLINRIDTKSHNKLKTEPKLEDQVPLRRLAEPREIADIVAFLVSDRSSYITGACLTADGGLSLAPIYEY